MYYRESSTVGGSCADRLKRELSQDSHAAFVRAVLFGLAGFAIWAGPLCGFILFVGMQFASKMTAGKAFVHVDGQFQLSNATSA
jgi:hypothetical protein